MKKMIVCVLSLALAAAIGTGLSAQTRKGRPKAAAGAPETIVYDALRHWRSCPALPASGTRIDLSTVATSSLNGDVAVKTKALGSAVFRLRTGQAHRDTKADFPINDEADWYHRIPDHLSGQRPYDALLSLRGWNRRRIASAARVVKDGDCYQH